MLGNRCALAHLDLLVHQWRLSSIPADLPQSTPFLILKKAPALLAAKDKRVLQGEMLSFLRAEHGRGARVSDRSPHTVATGCCQSPRAWDLGQLHTCTGLLIPRPIPARSRLLFQLLEQCVVSKARGTVGTAERYHCVCVTLFYSWTAALRSCWKSHRTRLKRFFVVVV